MEFIFLGTGAGVPAKQRNVTAIVLRLLERKGAIWLFDCGEGTQHQILRTKIKPSRIENIFISHLHGDHIFGLPGLLGSRSFQGGITPVTIYGPVGIKQFVETTLATSGTHLKYNLEIVEIIEGQIYADEAFTVEAILQEHAIESYGFRIVEKDMPGALDVEKLRELGIPAGPIYQQIKNGETITLANGQEIKGQDFVKAPLAGRILAISGDTRKTAKLIPLAQDADWLIHEATFRAGQEDMAKDFFHSTNVEAATLANEVNVKNLILTHISSRFQEEDMAMFLEEATAIFPNTQVAHDFLTVKLPRDNK